MSLISRALTRKAQERASLEPPTERQLAEREAMRRKRATVSWISFGASVMAVLTSLSSGLIHIGVGLSVAGSIAQAAVMLTDDASDNPPPLLVRLIPGAFIAAAVICLIIGYLRR